MDFDKLYFKKQGDNYKVFIKVNDNLKPVGLKAKLNIPFGLELYKNKEIINLEIPLEDGNNDVHNFHANISQIEKYFNRHTYDENINKYYKVYKPLLDNLELKQYVSAIKRNPNLNLCYGPISRKEVMSQKLNLLKMVIFSLLAN